MPLPVAEIAHAAGQAIWQTRRGIAAQAPDIPHAIKNVFPAKRFGGFHVRHPPSCRCRLWHASGRSDRPRLCPACRRAGLQRLRRADRPSRRLPVHGASAGLDPLRHAGGPAAVAQPCHNLFPDRALGLHRRRVWRLDRERCLVRGRHHAGRVRHRAVRPQCPVDPAESCPARRAGPRQRRHRDTEGALQLCGSAGCRPDRGQGSRAADLCRRRMRGPRRAGLHRVPAGLRDEPGAAR